MQFADAITGGVLAAKDKSGIILLKDALPEVVAEYIRENDITGITVFGGSGAVSEEVVQALQGLLQ